MENNSKQKNQSVYSVTSIVLGSFFAGPLATFFMLYKNYKAFGNKKFTKKIAIPGFFLAFSYVLGLYFTYYLLFDWKSSGGLKEGVLDFFILVLLILQITYSTIVWLSLDKKIIDNFLKNRGSKRGLLSLFSVILLALFGYFFIAGFLFFGLLAILAIIGLFSIMLNFASK